MAEAFSSVVLPPDFRLFAFECIDSTNAEALRRLEAGAARHFDVLVAASQSAGRGRRGRPWHSPAGNLHLTLIVMPPAQAAVGQLAFVAALAVGDAVGATVPAAADLRYKWPNDVLLDDRKLAGLLIEGGGNGKRNGLAIGIGVNVGSAPPGTDVPAASLRDAGASVTAAALIAPVCAAFARWFDRWRSGGFAPLRQAWLERAYGIGGAIEVRLPDGTVRRGVFRDLDRDGALLIEAAGGGVSVIAAADIFFAAA